MLMKLSSSFFFPFAILNYQACGLFIDSTADRLHSPHIPFLITPNPKILTYSPFPECDVYIQAFNSAMTQINCAYLNSNPQLLTFLTYVLILELLEPCFILPARFQYLFAMNLAFDP